MIRRLIALSRLAGSLVVVFGSVILTGSAIRWALVETFRGVNPSVAAAIVAAVATGLISLGTVVLQRRYERRQLIEREIREKKVDIYLRLVGLWFDIFGLGEERSDEESTQAQERVASAMIKMTPELVTWASDPVLASWAHYRRRLVTGMDGHESLFMFEQVLMVIRRDLGHANKDLVRGDLLALWINDVDEFKAPPES
jgi:hypothetical protein